MKIEAKILENGNLEISLTSEIVDLKGNYLRFEGWGDPQLKFLENIKEIFFNQNPEYRFIDNMEKYWAGDLTSAPILTNLPYPIPQNGLNINNWNERTWWFPNYQITDWREELILNGKTIFQMRGNA